VIATLGPIQNDESRVNIRFGVARTVRQLVERHPGHQHPGQRRRLQRAQVCRKFLRQRQTQPSRIDSGGDAVHAGRPAGQRLGQQIRQQQHLDATRPQQRGERIVLLLRLGDPRQTVEQQRVVVAWCQSLQFGARAVQDDDPQRANLGVAAQHGLGHI
jgi:hypothetical protein